jgi:hypothetical protein
LKSFGKYSRVIKGTVLLMQNEAGDVVSAFFESFTERCAKRSLELEKGEYFNSKLLKKEVRVRKG